jgi:peptidoglycan/xylan/chitin deacetylase (PgdA/CDA1 family)
MSKSKITSICYHYLKRKDIFNRIWGHDIDLFKKHMDFLNKKYKPISIKLLRNYIQNKTNLPNNCSIITFDDGLKEHSEIIGPYLSSLGISAVFNVCTDTLLKREPVIPQIIHFGTAYFGIREFVNIVEKHIKNHSLYQSYFDFMGNIKTKTPLEINDRLKLFFNKKGDHINKLCFMRYIWHNELVKIDPFIMDKIFMNIEDVKKLIFQGHTIGLHTASHIQISNGQVTDEFIEKEIINAKKDLENILNIPIDCFAYPFGSINDVINNKSMVKTLKTLGFNFIFTTFFDGDVNFRAESIGRYLTQSDDSVSILESKLWTYEISNNYK